MVLLLVGSNRGIVQRALELLEAGRSARAEGRGPRGDLGGAYRGAADHRGGPAPGAAHVGALGHPALGPLLARARGPRAAAAHDPGRGVEDLSRPLARPDWEAAIAATAFAPDEVVAQLCEAMGLIGAAEDCAARIVELTKLGVQNLYLDAV